MSYTVVTTYDNADNTVGTAVAIANVVNSAGDRNLVFVTYGSGSRTVESISHNSNTYNYIGTLSDATNGQSWAILECRNTSASAGSTLTFNLASGEPSRGVCVVRISGLDTAVACIIAQNNPSNPGTGAGAVTSTNLTPAAQPGALVGFVMDDSGGEAGIAASAGFTDLGAISTWEAQIGIKARFEHKAIASTAAVAATFTATTGTGRFGVMAAYMQEPASAGGAAGPLRGYQDDIPVAYYVDPGWAALYGQEQQGIPLANRDNVAAPTIVSAAFSSTAAATVQGVGASTNSGDISETATATVVGVPNAIAAGVIASAGTATVLGVSNNSGTIVSGDGFIAATATVLGVGASRNAADISAVGVATPLGVGASVASGVITEAAVATVQGVGAGGNIVVSADGSISASASVQGVGASTAAGAFSCAAVATVKGVPRSNARRIFGGSIHERKARIRAEIEEEEILELAALLVPLMSPGGALCLR